MLIVELLEAARVVPELFPLQSGLKFVPSTLW